MTQNQYKEQFISESKDHIESINRSLLEFEKDTSNKEVIDNLFRSFHTLKGNSSTMEFNKFAEIAHHLEDLLDRIRNDRISAGSEIVEILFKGADCLENSLCLVAEDRPEDIDDNGIIEEIKRIVGCSGESTASEINQSFAIEFTEEEKEKIDKIKKEKNLYYITLEFDMKNSLKGAKTLIVLRNLDNNCEIIKTFPSQEKIKSSNFDTKVCILVATDEEKDFLMKILESITGLSSYEVSHYDDDKNVSEDSGNENKKDDNKFKEADKHKIAKQQQEAMSKQIQSVKIDIKSLDNLMDLVGELLISKVRLEQFSKQNPDKEFNSVVDNLSRLTVDIQDEVMKQRMIPIGYIFNRFPRMVRDLAKKENKKVNLVIKGQDIEFDRTILDEVGDPLVHLLRNSVDHGIETVEERQQKGKEPEGTITLVAKKEKTNAIIEIIDDGEGIAPEKVKESSIKKGIIKREEAEQLTDKELKRLIFRPGISTNENVTEVSGRGVGMDVVENKIKNLGGNVKLDSEPGKGTSIKLMLPLTLAIVNSLIVSIDESKYAIPLSTIVRTVKVKKGDIKTIHGNSVFLLMNEDLPMVWLSELLHGIPAKDLDTYTVIVIEKDDNKIGVVVDSIVTQQQVLIKGLDEMVKGVKGLGGATILGDGMVSMILDFATLFD